ncbi:hypothetical protein BDZ89DRAFT_435112 [Hymenopellis radicata]|nr:hypothetical protein BDZ89DRAFT_435112 [Hymenopellis radicata]
MGLRRDSAVLCWRGNPSRSNHPAGQKDSLVLHWRARSGSERVPVPEAVAHIPNVMRNQLNIRHPGGEAIFFDFFVGNEHSRTSVLPYMTAHLKIGYTVAIMYAVHTAELNLLAESREMITIFPCGLERLHELGRFTDSSSNSEGLCLSCKVSASKTCGRCKAGPYCSKECQVRHWRTEHKHECPIINSFASGRRWIGSIMTITGFQ